MLEKLLKILESFNTPGVKLPFAYDPATKKPSISLLTMYSVLVLAIVSNIFLILKDVETGTYTAIVFWCLATVFYMMRKLTSVKIDVDDRSIALENNKQKKEKDNE
jgi:hypothetical protein